MLKQFKNGLIQGAGIVVMLGLSAISYAAFTTFTDLQATNNEQLTSTKWNNLVDAVEEEYLTDGSEVRTNKTWDGKPVYRKILTSTVNTDNGNTYTALIHSDAEMMFIRDIYVLVPEWGNSYITTTWQPIGYYLGGAINYSTKIANAYSNHSYVIGNTALIEVEYTKTTDIAE